jgi:hypothetical protein
VSGAIIQSVYRKYGRDRAGMVANIITSRLLKNPIAGGAMRI